MAVEFMKGIVESRGSVYRIDPLKITIDPQLNGRHKLPEIDTLVADILSKPDGHSIKGQTTPVIIRKDGLKAVLVAGHRRYRAVLKINKDELTPEPLMLLCVYMQLTEVEALAVAVTENRERAGITPLDEAYCVKSFLRLGKDHEWIALHGGFFPTLGNKYAQGVAKGDGDEFRGELKKATAWVKKREKLLGLTEEAQAALSSGKVKSVSAAEHLADLEADKQRELVKRGKVTSKDISKAAGKVQKITMKEVKSELDDLISEFAKDMPDKANDRLCKLRDRL